MARTIYGKVVDSQNKPHSGVKIEAWDKDHDADDRMGYVYTNSKGEYKMTYRGGRWDPTPHKRITIWRPDIYVTAKIRNLNGNWMQVTKSRVYKNHKLKNDKKIDLKFDVATVQKADTGFSVSKYAFKFPNSFKPVVDLFDENWGFCGGMCAGALHRFNHKCPVPSQKTTPKKGSKLYKELWERQKDTLSLELVNKIYKWQVAPDFPHWHTGHSLRRMQKAEIPLLAKYLDKKAPVILCLIRQEGAFASVTDNHQVLAIGYEYEPTPRNLTVKIYDPNDRKGVNKIQLCLSGGRLGAKQIDSEGKTINLRAFFVMDTTKGAAKKHY